MKNIKFFKKFAAVALGFVMTLGVGAAGYASSASSARAASGTFNKVTSTSSLAAGDVIILKCDSKSAYAGPMGSNTYLTSVSKIDDAIEMTLSKSGSNWKFTTSEGTFGTSKAKALTKNGGTQTWSITIDASGNASITSTTSSYGTIGYNAGSPRFLNYTSSQTAIQIYKKATASTKWSVTYDGNGSTGGSVPTDSNEYSSSSNSVTVLGNTGNLTKNGYEFAYWTTDKDGNGTHYTAGNSYTISSDTTFFAQWTSLNYTIKFNCGEGSSTMGDVTQNIAVAYTIPACTMTAPEGCGFDYWSGSNSHEYHPNDVIAANTFSNGQTLTLTAMWKELPPLAVYDFTAKNTISLHSDTIAPTGSSVTIANTYSGNYDQMTAGNSVTFTASGYDGYIIKGITLGMHSNGSAGKGTLSVTVGDTSIAGISSTTAFNSWYDNTSYGTAYRDVHVTLTNDSLVVGTNEKLTIVVSCVTTNSLYVNKFEISYERYVAPTISSISVESNPTITNYFDGDHLNLDGVSIEGTLSTGDTVDVTNECTFSPADDAVLSPSMTSVSVSYTGSTYDKTDGCACTTSFDINVQEIVLSSITLSGDVQTTFIVNNEFNSDNLVVTAHFNNGDSETVESGYNVSSPDMTTTGTKTITVTYGGKTATYEITVKDITLVSISIGVESTHKVKFNTGDTFSYEGLVVYANYDDSSSSVVSPDSVVGNNLDMDVAGIYLITVSYSNQTTQYSITVIDLQLTSITLSGNYETEFYVGDTFSYEGLVVNAHFTDSTQDTTVTPDSVSSPNMQTAGNQTISVSYAFKGHTETATYTILVRAIEVTDIELNTESVKTKYIYGEVVDTTGLVVTLKHNHGSDTEITEGFTVTAPDMYSTGSKNVSITYSGITKTYAITVYEAELLDIVFKSTDGGDATKEGTSIDDLISLGADYISETGFSASKAYNGKTNFGVKLGSSKASGSISFNLNNKIKPTKVIVQAAKYGTDTGSITVTLGSTTKTIASDDLSSTEIKSFEYTFDGKTEISNIGFATTSGRGYVVGIKFMGPLTKTQLVANPSSLTIYKGYTATVSGITAGDTAVDDFALETSSNALSINGKVITGVDYVTDATVRVIKATANGNAYIPCDLTVSVIDRPTAYYIHYVDGLTTYDEDAPAGDTITLKSLEKDGYTFVGWSESTSLTDPITSLVMPEHDVTLYAVWSQNHYTVTYDLNGGAGTVTDSNSYVFDDEVTVLSGEGVIKDYKTFSGWSDGTTVYKAGDKFNIQDNVILTAVWGDQEVTISFNVNGGSGSTPQSVKVVKGEAYENVKNPSVAFKDGAPFGTEFKGWNTESDGSGTHYDVGSTIECVTKDMTLYAEWKVLPLPDSEGSTIVFSEYYAGETATTVDLDGESFAVGNATITFHAAEDAQNPVKYYTNGSKVRIYVDNSFTISSESDITKVIITCASGYNKSFTITDSIGEITDDGAVATWEGSSKSVTFNSVGSSRIDSITIFAGGGTPEGAIIVENLSGVGTTNPIVLNDGTTVTGLVHKYGLLFQGESVSFTAEHGKVITYASVYMLYDYGYDLEYSNDYGATWDYNPFAKVTRAKRAEGAGTEVGDLKDTNAVRFTLNDPESEAEKDILKCFKVTTSFGTNSNMTVDYNWEKNGSQYTIDVTKAYSRFAIDVDEDFNKYFTEKDQYGKDYWIGFAYSTTGGNVIVDDHLATGVSTVQYTKGEMPANNEFGLKLNCLSNLKQDKTVALIVMDSEKNLVEFSKQKTASFEDVFYAYFTDDVVAGLNAEELAVYNTLLDMLSK